MAKSFEDLKQSVEFVNWEGVPRRLKSQQGNWLRWELIDDGKNRKQPYNGGGGMVGWQEPDQWRDFGTVRAEVRQHGGGVGWPFGADATVFGLDLDSAVDEWTGKPLPWAQSIIDRFNSYTELSPGGTGYHIFIEACELPIDRFGKKVLVVEDVDGGKNQQVEIFVASGFLTVTGRHIAGTPKDVRGNKMSSMAWLFREYGKDVLASSGSSVPITRKAEGKVAETIESLLFHIDLVRVCGSHHGTFPEWSRVGLALRECNPSDEFRDMFIRWSRSQPQYHGEGPCNKVWNSHSRDEGALATLRTLTRLALSCGWEPTKQQSDLLEAFHRDQTEIPIQEAYDTVRAAIAGRTTGGHEAAQRIVTMAPGDRRGRWRVVVSREDGEPLPMQNYNIDSSRNRSAFRQWLEEQFDEQGLAEYLFTHVEHCAQRPAASFRPKQIPSVFNTGWLLLPTVSGVSQDASMEQVMDILAQHNCYCRGNVITDSNLEVISPRAMVSFLGKQMQGRIGVMVEGRPVTAPLTEQYTRLVAEAHYHMHTLRQVEVLAPCPVPVIDADGGIVINTGYHERSKTLVAEANRNLVVEDVPVSEAVKLLKEISVDYLFQTQADFSRHIAGMLTPALVLGGVLTSIGADNRAPMDFNEALEPQSGKGYRQRLIADIYGAEQAIVQQSRGIGVGNQKELFDQEVIKGTPMVLLDNFRGSGQSWQFIESFLTERVYTARCAFIPAMTLDPRRFVLALTSNGIQVSPDMIRRLNIVRIHKREPDAVDEEGNEYTTWTEFKGDDGVLRGASDHVKVHRGRYLGAIYAIIKHWDQEGRPRIKPRSGSAFSYWQGMMDWIVRRVFELPSIHEDVNMEGLTSPGVNTLKLIGRTVLAAGFDEQHMSVQDIISVIQEAGRFATVMGSCEQIPNHNHDDADMNAAYKIARTLGGLFSNGHYARGFGPGAVTGIVHGDIACFRYRYKDTVRSSRDRIRYVIRYAFTTKDNVQNMDVF